MTAVQTSGGRTVNLADYNAPTIGAAALAIARDVYPDVDDAAKFSLKVDGTVADQNANPQDLGIGDGTTLELVDVTGYAGPTETGTAPVDLVETTSDAVVDQGADGDATHGE